MIRSRTTRIVSVVYTKVEQSTPSFIARTKEYICVYRPDGVSNENCAGWILCHLGVYPRVEELFKQRQGRTASHQCLSKKCAVVEDFARFLYRSFSMGHVSVAWDATIHKGTIGIILWVHQRVL